MTQDRLSTTFAALADPTRRAILARLGAGESSVVELAKPFAMSLPAVSKHLKVLERSGLITRRRRAQWRPCRLRARPLREVAEWVGGTAASGRRALTAWRNSWANFNEREKTMDPGNEMTASDGDREIVVTRDFGAPRELVWQAMTDPRQVVNWWGPRGFTTTIQEMDVRPGGAWVHVMRGPDGAEFPNKSVFKEVVRPERIVYSHGGGKKGGPVLNFEAAWTFEALDAGRTRVTMRSVFPSAADRDRIVREFGAIEGAKQTLARLAEHLLKNGPVGERVARSRGIGPN